MAGTVVSGCPPPFLNEHDFPFSGGQQDGRLCSPVDANTTCCLPCPFTDWIYPDNFNTVTTAANWVGLGSTLCCAILLISFAVLPVRKTSRHYLTVCLIAGVGLLTLGFVIPLGAQPKQCHDSITPNNMNSDLACAFSGAAVLLGGMASTMWVLIRSLSLHLQICWQIVPGKKFFYVSMLAGWGVPILFGALSLALSGVSYRFGSVCHINHDFSLATFWGPIMGCVGIAAICQFATLGYCIRVYLKSLMDTGGTYATSSSNAASATLPSVGSVKAVSARAAYRRVRKVIALQWRGVMVVIILIVSSAYFTTIFLKLDNITVAMKKDPESAIPWLSCLYLSGGNKNQCLPKVKGLILDEPTVVTVLYLIAIMGFWCVLFLGRVTMIAAWWEFICGFVKKDDSWISADARRMSDPRNYEMLTAPTQQYYMSKGPAGLVATATVPAEKDKWPLSPLSPLGDTKEMQTGSAISDFSPTSYEQSPVLQRSNSMMQRTLSASQQASRPLMARSASQSNGHVAFSRETPANMPTATLSPRSNSTNEYYTPQAMTTPGQTASRNNDYFSRPFSRGQEGLRRQESYSARTREHGRDRSGSDNRGWFGHSGPTPQRSDSSLGRRPSNRTPTYEWDYQKTTFVQNGSDKRQSRQGALSPGL